MPDQQTFLHFLHQIFVLYLRRKVKMTLMVKMPLGMTVQASYLALLDLSFDGTHSIALTSRCADVKAFDAPDMVKGKDDGIGLFTIDTGMLLKVLGDELTVS
jgi:hypothetical protein